MLIDLKAHYLDLIVGAIEAGGNACLHRPDSKNPDGGAIYVTKGDGGETRAEYVLRYEFGERAFRCAVEFSDERPAFLYDAYFVDGLDKFWPAFRRALSANRLEDRSHEPERVDAEHYQPVGARQY